MLPLILPEQFLMLDFNYQPAAVNVHDGGCDSDAGHGRDRRLFLTVVSDGGVACRHT